MGGHRVEVRMTNNYPGDVESWEYRVLDTGGNAVESSNSKYLSKEAATSYGESAARRHDDLDANSEWQAP